MKYITSLQAANLLGVTKRYINTMCAKPWNHCARNCTMENLHLVTFYKISSLSKGNPYDVQEAATSRGSAARSTLTIKCPLKQHNDAPPDS